jgi:CubicO group peptidase (beta-lactamase class C family)
MTLILMKHAADRPLRADQRKVGFGFLPFAFAAAFGVVAFRAVADSPVPQAPLELTAANLASVVDPLMAEWIDERKGPGAVVVVVKRDALVFAKGYGFADIEAKKPFTADATLVRPGSISKLFTGIAVMQLVDAGRLDLDRDVNGYIDFAIPVPDGGVPVTLRRLLTHRAGFEDHWKGLWKREPEPLGRWLARNLPQRLFPKGDVEAYSNYGLALAWLGVFGAVLTLWAAALFWRNGVGNRWSRIHHSLIAASSVMIAWFFVTFHIAGTTLTY